MNECVRAVDYEIFNISITKHYLLLSSFIAAVAAAVVAGGVVAVATVISVNLILHWTIPEGVLDVDVTYVRRSYHS